VCDFPFHLKVATPSLSKAATARSWLKVGNNVELDKARVGDLAIFWRGSPDSWMGHVAIFLREEDGFIWCLGGNQDDSVCIKKYQTSRLLGIRRV